MADSTKLSLIWDRTEKKSVRGPQPAFRLDQIASAAVRLADTEGLDAVSMRRIATELGASTMSLYRYVRSKEELIDLMVDTTVGRFRIPDRVDDWRADLTALAELQRATARKHPWMIAVSVRSTLGPHGLALREASLNAVESCGLSADDMLLVVLSVSTFVRGYVAEEVAEQQTLKASGVSRADWMKAQTEYVSAIRQTGDYPLFIRIIDEAETPHSPKLLAKRFERGLNFLLDGIAMQLSSTLPNQRRKGLHS